MEEETLDSVSGSSAPNANSPILPDDKSICMVTSSTTQEASESIQEESLTATNERETTLIAPNDSLKLMFGSVSSTKTELKSAKFEFGSSTKIVPSETCGFDSADSTNDADFLSTQEAVQSAIQLVDRGLEDESETVASGNKGSGCISDGKSQVDNNCTSTDIKDVIRPHIESNIDNTMDSIEEIENKSPAENNISSCCVNKENENNDTGSFHQQLQSCCAGLIEERDSSDSIKLKEDINKRISDNENKLFDDENNHSNKESKSPVNVMEREPSANVTDNKLSDTKLKVSDNKAECGKKEDKINNKSSTDSIEGSIINKILPNDAKASLMDMNEINSSRFCTQNSSEKDSKSDLPDKSLNSNNVETHKVGITDLNIEKESKDIDIESSDKSVSITDELSKMKVTEPKKNDDPGSADSKVEFVDQSADGDVLAVTLENVEVSVFEDGSNDQFSSGFFKSLKKSTDKCLVTQQTSENKQDKQKSDGFKLDDAVLTSDEDEYETTMDCDFQGTSQFVEDSNKRSLSEVVEKSSKRNNQKEFKLDDASSSSDEGTNRTLIETPKCSKSELDDIPEYEKMEVEEIDEPALEEKLKPSKQSEFLDSDKNENGDQKVRGCKNPPINNSISTKDFEVKSTSTYSNTDETSNDANDNNCTKPSMEVENLKEISETQVKSSLSNDKPDYSSKLDDEVADDNDRTDIIALMQSALARNEEFRKNVSLDLNKSGQDKSSGTEKILVCKEAEVISLVDDDDDEINRIKKPAAASKCVNPNCMSGEELGKPAMFVLTYFGLKRARDQQVCAECFNLVLEQKEKLVRMLKDGTPLFTADFPSHKDVILLEDSDEESFSDDEGELSDDTMSMIRYNLDDVIAESLFKYRLDHQIRESCDWLNNKLDTLEDEAKELTSRFDKVQNTLDEFRKCIYKDFNQKIEVVDEVHITDCEIPPMPIAKSKLQNQLYNRLLMNHLRKTQQEKEANQARSPPRSIATKKVTQISQSSYESVNQDVIAVHSEQRCDPPSSLPPPGPLIRPKLKVGDLAYTMKVSYFSIWVLARVVEVIPRNTTEADSSTETYRVRLENVKKNSVRTVTGKYLAYTQPARVQLKVGTRVIAIFREEDESTHNRDNYYVGIVAEPPKSTNKYRYLVFFDDGYTQYCPHNNILVVCWSSKNIWEDIHPEPRGFIRNYLQQYPERPMVKMSRGQVVKVEWNGRWWIVRVLEVDASLVKVHFDADKRTEWIYRGSTRLGPMYQELAAARERQSGSLLRSRGFGTSAQKNDMPYVEYTRGDGDEKKDEEKDVTEAAAAVPVRSVAKKSTAKKQPDPIIYPKQHTVMQRTFSGVKRPILFRPHQCNKSCVAWTDYSPAAAKKYDPLVKPLMFGFSRLNMTYRGKPLILYRAPCGRMIRSQQEMLCYLQGTRSSLTIDLFDFDFWVNPLNVFQEGKSFSRIEDLSYGKENVPISCVNDLDHSMPQYVQYMTARQPTKDVNLVLDQEFLVGCDCKDDCEDRSKCSCWQLTMQGKAYIPDGDLDPLFGYQYRRLPERIATGIYECNSRCKCSATCQNRVAQQPLSCRLQLFKTPKKGWGIRCLHDIPRGAFICIYAGFLLTEQEANEGGKTYGDEYLAELDYIESVENLKEGYESEAKEMSDMSDMEEEDDDGSKMYVEYEDDPNSQDSDIDNSQKSHHEDIRLRLRRRAIEDSDKDSSRRSKGDDDAISISDEEVDSDAYYYTVSPLSEKVRKPQTFNNQIAESDDKEIKYPSVRDLYGEDEKVFVMDAKTHGNIGRYLNHSCSPNVFVQNVFVDTHDLRFPWVAFFANQYILAGTELTWDYNYDVGSVPGKVMLCYCNSPNCRGRLL